MSAHFQINMQLGSSIVRKKKGEKKKKKKRDKKREKKKEKTEEKEDKRKGKKEKECSVTPKNEQFISCTINLNGQAISSPANKSFKLYWGASL